MPQFPKIKKMCHSFSMTDDDWDSSAPLAINQTAGQGERTTGGSNRQKVGWRMEKEEDEEKTEF